MFNYDSISSQNIQVTPSREASRLKFGMSRGRLDNIRRMRKIAASLSMKTATVAW